MASGLASANYAVGIISNPSISLAQRIAAQDDPQLTSALFNALESNTLLGDSEHAQSMLQAYTEMINNRQFLEEEDDSIASDDAGSGLNEKIIEPEPSPEVQITSVASKLSEIVGPSRASNSINSSQLETSAHLYDVLNGAAQSVASISPGIMKSIACQTTVESDRNTSINFRTSLYLDPEAIEMVATSQSSEDLLKFICQTATNVVFDSLVSACAEKLDYIACDDQGSYFMEAVLKACVIRSTGLNLWSAVASRLMFLSQNENGDTVIRTLFSLAFKSQRRNIKYWDVVFSALQKALTSICIDNDASAVLEYWMELASQSEVEQLFDPLAANPSAIDKILLYSVESRDLLETATNMIGFHGKLRTTIAECRNARKEGRPPRPPTVHYDDIADYPTEPFLGNF